MIKTFLSPSTSPSPTYNTKPQRNSYFLWREHLELVSRHYFILWPFLKSVRQRSVRRRGVLFIIYFHSTPIYNLHTPTIHHLNSQLHPVHHDHGGRPPTAILCPCRHHHANSLSPLARPRDRIIIIILSLSWPPASTSK